MSKIFRIEIIETLSKTITVNAENDLSALQKVKEDYKNEDIVLDSDNYVTTEFILQNTDNDRIGD